MLHCTQRCVYNKNHVITMSSAEILFKKNTNGTWRLFHKVECATLKHWRLFAQCNRCFERSGGILSRIGRRPRTSRAGLGRTLPTYVRHYCWTYRTGFDYCLFIWSKNTVIIRLFAVNPIKTNRTKFRIIYILHDSIEYLRLFNVCWKQVSRKLLEKIQQCNNIDILKW